MLVLASIVLLIGCLEGAKDSAASAPLLSPPADVPTGSPPADAPALPTAPADAPSPPLDASAGTVCIAPVRKEDGLTEHMRNPEGAGGPFTIQIDEKEPVDVLEAGAHVCVSDLTLGQRHTVVVRSSGKPYGTFTFTFEEQESKRLELWYESGYAHWRLRPDRSRP